ncbi:hypothetical protein, conserved, UPF0175 family [Thermococcus kodakarensis KOD1]|uniref:Uncharacterized protein n=1 Tax=Thermococcus kodakarensis (strain ATCC BAA-918 / JCM 12380 / KOD1) TaxID=69014 RepID=Q5JFP8_THEKO|nr:UPF0175 family protein [Thermococcus kodakarensis]WCN28303.1 UPF0175 family protein [Thermococcus kodakarensis]WCN30598.1 UPF0175 family protein [Thermococcus kodakarensis]BAD84402.1 hypothetical protein, conserved, UPF0175 family [Thermococcus kodakarensis KOD1]
MGEVTVVIPSDLSRILRVDEKQLPKLVRIYLAVELYREGVVSLGKAAEIAGVTKAEMMEILASKGVPLNYTEEDLQEDIETLERLL